MRVLHLEDDAMKYANIQRVLNRGGITDIVCSSINEKIPNILGNVWYQEKRDWETEMLNLLKYV